MEKLCCPRCSRGVEGPDSWTFYNLARLLEMSSLQKMERLWILVCKPCYVACSTLDSKVLKREIVRIKTDIAYIEHCRQTGR